MEGALGRHVRSFWLISARLSQSVRALSRYFLALHWFVQVLVVWLAGRLFTVLLVLTVARAQGPNPWSSPNPGYFDYINGWDAGYYEEIFDHGYPAELPRDQNGAVLNSPWAFYPVFPFLVRGLSSISGLPWLVAAPTISMVASLAFFVIAYSLFRERASHEWSLVAISAMSFGVAAAVVQFPYAESVGLALLAALLWLLVRKRYLLASAVIVLIAFTRPLAAPIAFTCVVISVVTVGAARYRGEWPSVRVWASLSTLVASSVIGVLAWPFVVGVVTGVPDAYFLTEASWHGGRSLVPGVYYLRSLAAQFGLLGGVVVAAMGLLAMAVVMLSRPVLRLGLVMWTWLGSLIGYLVLIAPVSGSIVRLAMPAFPLVLSAAVLSRSQAYRALLIAVLAAAQLLWLALLWHWGGVGAEPAP